MAGTQEKYENRRNVTYAQGLRYMALMDGIAREVCLKTFDGKGQAVYNGLKTTPSLTIAGSNKSFLTANSYSLAYGRNISDEDVELARSVVVIGKAIEKRLFPHESPIGRVIKLSGHAVTIIGVLEGERDSLRTKPGRYLCHPDYPFLRELRVGQALGKHRHPIVLAGIL